ncbi:hypothetical protein ACOSQ2_009575 [Xanthoceras sorbifolium]
MVTPVALLAATSTGLYPCLRRVRVPKLSASKFDCEATSSESTWFLASIMSITLARLCDKFWTCVSKTRTYGLLSNWGN